MAVEKSALNVTELDFDSIKNNLKEFLRSQSEFTDYDFEGSGMSVLLDILAYNTHYMGYYLNMVGNEMFLDTAQLRASILSHAKAINYVPASRQGAQAKINVKVTPAPGEDQNATYITLDKYTKLFSVDKEGMNYPFVTLYSNTASKVGGSFNFSNVTIKQGEVITLQYQMDPLNTSRRFDIPSQNVDTTTILVNVQESPSNTDTSTYVLAQDITELTGDSKVYFIEENENLTYTLYFGDNIIGKKPKNGSVIIVTYLDNLGEKANNISNFVFNDPIAGLYSDNVQISTTATSYGGLEKETIDEVRFRAPYFYTTQNRAVTKYDYKTLMKKDYDFIDYISVWGGEDNDPVVYGKVFISVKPKGNYQLTNLEKERIKNEIIKERGILTVTPEIVDPDYVYIMIRGKIYYDSKLTTLSANQLTEYIRAAIQDYSVDELNTFDSVFRKTKLENYIENADPSITTCDIKVFAQKRFRVDPGQSKNYTIKYNFHVQHDDENRLSTFPSIQLYDLSSVVRDSYIEEEPHSDTGIYSILVGDGGINYTTAPTVTIRGDGSGATAVAEVIAGRVSYIKVINPGKNYTYATAVLEGGNGSGATIKEVQLEIERGYLRSYYFKESGEKVIIRSGIGTIYHPTGLITLDSLRVLSTTENAFYDTDYLTMSVMVKDGVIYPLRNRVITIDDKDPRAILIDVIAE